MSACVGVHAAGRGYRFISVSFAKSRGVTRSRAHRLALDKPWRGARLQTRACRSASGGRSPASRKTAAARLRDIFDDAVEGSAATAAMTRGSTWAFTASSLRRACGIFITRPFLVVSMLLRSLTPRVVNLAIAASPRRSRRGHFVSRHAYGRVAARHSVERRVRVGFEPKTQKSGEKCASIFGIDITAAP